MKYNLNNKFKMTIVLGLLFTVWAVSDLSGPWHTNLKEFEPETVARLETDMWRSYYNKESFHLYGSLVEMLHGQQGFPFLRANYEAYLAAKAAIVFKKGDNHNDYRQALPYLVKYFYQMKRIGELKCNPEEAARKELKWWIVHRERSHYGKETLIKSIADAAGALYSENPNNMMDYARERAEAMIIRDDEAAGDGVNERDWQQINSKLSAAYKALYNSLNQKIAKNN